MSYLKRNVRGKDIIITYKIILSMWKDQLIKKLTEKMEGFDEKPEQQKVRVPSGHAAFLEL